jgi:chloramphenicol 3-O phosphotransferase
MVNGHERLDGPSLAGGVRVGQPADQHPVRWPHVVLVNGASSAGKTSLCRGLQAAIAHPYLCIGFDDFVFTAPARYYRGADTSQQSDQDQFTSAGVRMVTTSPPGAPRSVTAVFGPVFQRLIDGMAPAVRGLVDAGNSIVFDHVLHDRRMYESLVNCFHGLDVFTVGVICPVEILEAREASRGDRVLGRARGLAELVHTFCRYDVVVDTGNTSPQECVDQVLEALARHTAEPVSPLTYTTPSSEPGAVT